MAVELYTNVAQTVVSVGGTTAPAAGTSENWTVQSSTSFPAASASAGTTFHINDTVKTSEIIQVTNISGNSWTVTRGVEGTTPVAHALGFTVKQVVTAGDVTAYQVAIQPSGDTSGATDTAAIQASLNFAKYALLAPGSFYIGTAGGTASGLTVPGATDTVGGASLIGSGSGVTKLFYIGNGTGIYSHGSQSGGNSYQGIGATIRDLEVDGSNCGAAATVIGIDIGDQYDILLDHVTVSNFTSSGTTAVGGTNRLGAVGINVANYVTLTEKCNIRHTTVNNCGTPSFGPANTPNTSGGAAIQFYANSPPASTTSHMYGDFDIHICQQAGQNGLVIANQGHLMNGRFRMRGNMNGPASGTNASSAVVIGVGNASPTSGHIQRMFLDIHVESDPGSLTLHEQPYDIYVAGNPDNTINRCWGRIQMLDGFQSTNLNIPLGAQFEFTGPIIGVTDLAVPASTTPTSGNQFTYQGPDAVLFVTGGAISAVNYAGTSMPSGTFGGPFPLSAGMQMTFTYSGSPVFTWAPNGQGY